MKDKIIIKGAKQHNLKNINLEIPKNKLVVFTGLSGSGKSSLAFDTIYAEGQRRYVESLSSYARQFLGIMQKPDVDQIDGLSPAISIDQKTTSHNPRSTVGTITEIYDYLRLLFARIGHPHCPKCNREIQKQSAQQITDVVLEMIIESVKYNPVSKFMLLSPLVRDKKGEFLGLFENLKQKGFSRVRVDGNFYDLDQDLVLIKTNRHTIEAVIERFTFDKSSAKNESTIHEFRKRISSSIETGLELSNGLIILSQIFDSSLTFPQQPKDYHDHLFSEQFACPECNISLPEIEPRVFSFNSPHGACTTCTGLGTILKIDPQKMIAPEITISEGAIIPFASMGSSDTWFSRKIEAVLNAHNSNVKTMWKDFDERVKNALLYGDSREYTIKGSNRQGKIVSFRDSFEGIVPHLERRYSETQSDFTRTEIEKYMKKEVCHDCHGTRLKNESLSVTIQDKNIAELTDLTIQKIFNFISNLRSPSILSDKEISIGNLIIKEIEARLNFLLSVGLNYLTLSREAGTLSGGEAQRIRLASQIGTGLTGVLYVLDEPSIGLHQRDNERLIETLKNLRDLDNTVIVVEHDRDIMLASDQLIDFGPKAGKDGGRIVAQGTPQEVMKNKNSITGKYLKGSLKIKNLSHQEESKSEEYLKLSDAHLHNLKHIDVIFPLHNLISVTGVSGSGKSTLIHDTLYQSLRSCLHGYRGSKDISCGYIEGDKYINKLSLIDQSPIGRTPRSNPATYTKIFDHIRNILSLTQESKIRGYSPGRYSFNVKGGRCETCLGEGQIKIEMQFMPDVYISCDVCHGSRYNTETLDIKYKGKNIAEILNLTVDEAVEFFKTPAALVQKLKTLQDVGLGYIQLGQPAPTLSGGEAQRVKLAKELALRSYGHALYLLDEPTTGLHFEDVKKLLYVLKALVNQGNTVIVIEHNLDIIKNSDWIIDLGPEGGEKGGEIVAEGSPREISNHEGSHTAKYLRQYFDIKNSN